MTKWQPIKTAPKDGSRFLIWIAGGGTYEIAIAWFDPIDPEVWQVQNLPLLGVRRAYLFPTDTIHIAWMPFPGAPNENV